MKTRIAIAVTIGAFVSILFDVLYTALHSTLLQYLALPGHIAMISIWGAHGIDRGSERTALIVGWGVNIITYSLIAFGVLSWFSRPDDPSPKHDDVDA